MADGRGVDVLEGGLQTEEQPKDTAAVRQAWRAEAEKAVEYFSAIPGFAPAGPEVRPTQAVPPDRAETADAPAPEVTAVAQEQEEQLPRRRLLSRLRHRLGRHPHPQPAPPPAAEEPVLAETVPSEEAPPEEAPPEESRATRFRSSF